MSSSKKGQSKKLHVSGHHLMKGCVPCRYIMTVVCMMGIMNIYGLRVNLSIAIVGMVNHTALGPSQSRNFTPECQGEYTNNTTTMPDGEFEWDEATQGLILGAFFWGYFITQLPGGFLAVRFGGKWIFGLSVAITGVLTLATPVVARWGPWYLVVLRILEGMSEGVTYPSLYVLLPKWAPPLELTTITTMVSSGGTLGTVISLPLAGLLCQYGFAGGWPSVFYCFGAVSLLWFTVYCFVIYEDPIQHPWISHEERIYIIQSTGANNNMKQSRRPVPWLAIFTSVPLWANMVASVGYAWGFYVLLTCLPLYMEEILRYDVKENGFLSALPYLAAASFTVITGVMVDKIRQHGIMTTNNIRKLVNTAGMFTNAVLLLLVGFVGCRRVWAVALLTLSSGFGSMTVAGISSNYLDLAPDLSGIQVGIVNAAATIAGIMAPSMVGVITNDQPTKERWMLVFYITAGIVILTALAFLIFGSTERQPWSYENWEINIDQSINTNDSSPLIPERERLHTLRAGKQYGSISAENA